MQTYRIREDGHLQKQDGQEDEKWVDVVCKSNPPKHICHIDCPVFDKKKHEIALKEHRELKRASTE